jgi:hypothetical protein
VVLLKRLIHQVGRRGTFLLYLGFLDFIYAFYLAFPTPDARNTPTLAFLDRAGSLYGWAALWGVVGALCLFFAFRRKDTIGYTAAIFLKVLWALAFLLGWVFAGLERGWLSAAIWGAFVVVLATHVGWRENPEDVR